MSFGNFLKQLWNAASTSDRITEQDKRDEKSPVTTINFLKGWPSTSLLPVDLVKAAASHALSELSVAHQGLLYGPDAGHEPCRQAIAEWLTSFYEPHSPIVAERICITGGASQSLGALLSVYTDPAYTRNIWIVAPAYMLAFRIFDDAGFHTRLRAVPEDEQGIDLEFLGRELRASEHNADRKGNDTPRFKPPRPWGKIYKHVIYCVPSFSNPSSRTMSLDRRRALVQLARQYDALIVPDDVYDFLQWDAQVPEPRSRNSLMSAHLPRLVDIDRDFDGGTDRPGADGFGNACSNGSFSKILGPGVRVGWVEGSAKFAYGASQAGTSRSGGAPSQLTSTYVTQLLNTHQLQKHIEDVLRPSYAHRYDTMVQAIQRHLFPLDFTLPQTDRDVAGGFFVWIGLPFSLKAQDLSEICLREEDLVIIPGHAFEVPGDASQTFERRIRLCFAWEDVTNLEEGVKRIASAARRMMRKHDETQTDFVVVDGEDQYDLLQNFK